MVQNHHFFLRRCLELAEKGRGKTGINPMVGAVLVRDGVIIAEGFHAEFGKAHAERDLLEKYDPTTFARDELRGAGQKIRSTDTLYVNLEPCCHANKKTPPCAQLLIERGIKNVVYGMKDPNPAVAGKGIELLNKNGVQTLGRVLEQECKRLNRGFVSLMTKQRPWITLKSARTSDGRIANQDRSPLKITSDQQDDWSHTFLRARHDAILVGVGTILSDDPKLTVRYPHPPAEEGFQPWRIIVDPHLKLPLDAKVVRRGTIVVTRGDEIPKLKALQDAGVRILQVPLQGDHFEWDILFQKLITPKDDFFGITSILVEGGNSTWKIFRNAGFIDEEVTLIARCFDSR
jgi:diaminohydroxyphosphoribosylaminopyrimidine deaminase/5-amino-6-(5-phosphoribosylamino)uracil reductase